MSAPVSVMDPKPGQRFVEFSKDGHGGKKSEGEGGLASGLDVETRQGYGKKIYISKVEGIAAQAGAQINPGDRVVALNGKKIEAYGSLDEIRSEFTIKNTVAMITDPTMLVE
jgi:C-terminal processing protease CtpA/Prc